MHVCYEEVVPEVISKASENVLSTRSLTRHLTEAKTFTIKQARMKVIELNKKNICYFGKPNNTKFYLHTTTIEYIIPIHYRIELCMCVGVWKSTCVSTQVHAYRRKHSGTRTRS